MSTLNRVGDIEHQITVFMQALHAMNLPAIPDEAQLRTVAAALQELRASGEVPSRNLDKLYIHQGIVARARPAAAALYV